MPTNESQTRPAAARGASRSCQRQPPDQCPHHRQGGVSLRSRTPPWSQARAGPRPYIERTNARANPVQTQNVSGLAPGLVWGCSGIGAAEVRPGLEGRQSPNSQTHHSRDVSEYLRRGLRTGELGECSNSHVSKRKQSSKCLMRPKLRGDLRLSASFLDSEGVQQPLNFLHFGGQNLASEVAQDECE
jgi:hypothetical protein